MNKKIENLIKEYDNITASQELKERVNKEMEKTQIGKKIVKLGLGLVAGLMIVTVASLNLSPQFAYAVAEIPGLKSIVKVITFGQYQFTENGYEANVVTPQLEGLLDKELENKLNAEFKENAQAVILAYEQEVKDLKAEYGDQLVHSGIEFNYQIKTDNQNTLAIDLYTLYTAGSSSTTHHFYTIDKTTGQLLTLPGLFKDNADYVTVLSDYLKTAMIKENQENEGMFWVNTEENMADDFKSIKADQNFYLNDNGELVIAFDKYEVAAGAQGSPEFVIPQDIIKDILK